MTCLEAEASTHGFRSRIEQLLHEPATPPEMLARVTPLLLEVLAADIAAIILEEQEQPERIEPPGVVLFVGEVEPGDKAARWVHFHSTRFSTPGGPGTCGLDEVLDYLRRQGCGRDVPTKHFLEVPLQLPGGPRGRLLLFRRADKPFSSRDEARLQSLLLQIDGAVHHRRPAAQAPRHDVLLANLFQHLGMEMVALHLPSTELFRTDGVTALLKRWFAPEEWGPGGLPEGMLARLTGLAGGTAAPARAHPDAWARSRGDRELRVSFLPLLKVPGSGMWALVLREMTRTGEALPALGACFTAREQEVVSRILLGWRNQLIAEDLGCATKTVKKHVEHIFNKLGVSSRTALIHLMSSRMHTHEEVNQK